MLHKCVNFLCFLYDILQPRTVETCENHSDFPESLLHELCVPLAQQQQPQKAITSQNAAK